jgi:hypothetical protein
MSSTADEKAAQRGKSIINLITPDEKVPAQEKPKPAPATETIDPVGQVDNFEGIEVDLNEELVDYNEDTILETTKAIKLELRDTLAKNGLAMRQSLKEHNIKAYYASPILVGTIPPEEVLLEVPAEDRQNLGLMKDQIIMPMNFFQKWLLPTIRVRKALKQLEDGNLPGGIETAMLYSIFDQSVMDLNRPLRNNFAENKALRAMVAHAKDDTMKHLSLSKEKIHGQTKGLLAALRQINETAQLPSAGMLWEMTEDDIEFRKKLIVQAITQYENHTNMDHAAMQLYREQCACLAHLVWEQQLHICDLNDRALRYIEERKKILNGNDTPIHKGVESIMDTMKQLQLSLTQAKKEGRVCINEGRRGLADIYIG